MGNCYFFMICIIVKNRFQSCKVKELRFLGGVRFLRTPGVGFNYFIYL